MVVFVRAVFPNGSTTCARFVSTSPNKSGERLIAIKNISALGKQVDEKTIVVLTLGDLRKAIGYERLGKYVLDEISSSLEGDGLGYFPLDVIEANPEPRQYQEVRVYRRGKGIGKVIQAVTDPTPAGDRLLRENSGQGMELIQQIRALVCPDPPDPRRTR